MVSCPGAYSCRLAVTQSRGMADALTPALAGPRRVAAHQDLRVPERLRPALRRRDRAAGLGAQGGGTRGARSTTSTSAASFGDGEASFGRLAAKVPARKVPRRCAAWPIWRRGGRARRIGRGVPRAAPPPERDLLRCSRTWNRWRPRTRRISSISAKRRRSRCRPRRRMRGVARGGLRRAPCLARRG